MTKPPLQRAPRRETVDTKPSRPAVPPPRRSLRDSLKIVPLATRRSLPVVEELPEWEAFAEPPETEVTGSRVAVSERGPRTDEFSPMALASDSHFDAYRPTQVLPDLTPNPRETAEEDQDLVRTPVLESTEERASFDHEFDHSEMTRVGVALADADEREREEEARKHEIDALLRAYLGN